VPAITFDSAVPRYQQSSAFYWLVEAITRLAFGTSMSSDDLWTRFVGGLPVTDGLNERQLATELSGSAEDTVSDFMLRWDQAVANIVAAASKGRLNLLGRRDDPTGEYEEIPVKFLAAEGKLVAGPDGQLWVRDSPKGVVYYEVKVFTADDFDRVFPITPTSWEPLTKPTEDEAESALEKCAAEWAAGEGTVPVKARFIEEWRLKIGSRPANRVWGKVAERHPSISSLKGKPHKRS